MVSFRQIDRLLHNTITFFLPQVGLARGFLEHLLYRQSFRDGPVYVTLWVAYFVFFVTR